MAHLSPVYCGRCTEKGWPNTPPESPDCHHFHDPDTIWFAAAGAALIEVGERPNWQNTKYVIQETIDLPSHPAFQSPRLEKAGGGETFKLPLEGSWRIHYKTEPHAEWFASLHGPETDPDPPATLQQLLGHALEVTSHDTTTIRERARLGRGRNKDPLYIFQEDRGVALNLVSDIA